MKNSINISHRKSLLLKNVLIKEIDYSSDKEDSEDGSESFELIVEQMETQIRVKGGSPIGPLIQYASANFEKQIASIKIALIRQSSEYIHKVDPGYKMQAVINVKNCLYARYTGPEEKLQFGYQKLQLVAFEEDIQLKGDSYTIFVDNDEEGNMVADIFMERADGTEDK